MNWIQNLCETYEKCKTQIGYADTGGQRPLLPICHSTTQAHIEIVIDNEGCFRRARVITDRQDSTTIIPGTEASLSRSGSKPENHPLCDKLQYVAGDFLTYGGTVTSGFKKDPEEPFRNYSQLLRNWCESPFAHPKAIAVLKYIRKMNLVGDLVNCGVLLLNSDGKFSGKEELEREKNAKDIFSVVDPQDNAFVRWVVETSDGGESRVWRDKTLWESWTQYYLNTRSDKDLCFITGKDQIITINHPKYIRREGDGAKLISANDTAGFTFRGRFMTDRQASSIGLDASQKAHYALSWLISRQGYLRDSLAIVAWAKSGAPVPQPTDDPIDMLFGNSATEEDLNVYTAQDTALSLKNRIAGYGKQIKDTESISVMAVDSATPGRLSITYYRELQGSDFLQRVDDWHASCAWLHDYREIKDGVSGKKKRVKFIGAPAPVDIAEASYGSRIDEKLCKATISRLLPCIVDGQPLPRDLVESAIRRASNRVGLKNQDDKKFHGDPEYTWNKTLSIACSLFKKSNRKEHYDMALDPDRKTRDYLYGRLLALADNLESWALREQGEGRDTNAARLMQRFSEHPYSTWRTLELALQPYKTRLGGKAYKVIGLIDEVIASFDEADFISDKRLSGEFLLGYHCQRENLRPAASKQNNDDVEAAQPIQDLNNE